MKTTHILTLACGLALLPWGAIADTPLQYGQRLSRNAVVEATDLPSHLGDDNALWKIDLHGKPFFNAIQIDGDIAYACMDARNLPEKSRKRVSGILCFNIHTGEILWQKEIDTDVDAYGSSIIPILEDDKIYLGVQTTAHCLDRDGNVLWKTDTKTDHFSAMHGSHGGGLIIGDYWWYPTGFSNGSDCHFWMSNSIERPWHPNFVVINKHTGKIVAQDDTILGPQQHGTWCSLTEGEINGKPTVFWGDGFGMVHAYEVPETFDDEGPRQTVKRLWSVDANPKDYRYAEDGSRMPYAGYMSAFGPRDIGPCEIIAPIVYKDGKIYVSIGRDKAYSPKVEGRHVGKGGVVCFDVTGPEPKRLWHNADVGRTFCPLSIVEDRAFVADHAGWMTALDLATGETLWQEDINACIWNYFQCWGDGKLYTMNERRDFTIIEADEDGGLLFNAVMDATNNPMVGMTDGILIVPTMRSIVAYGGPEYMKTHQPMTPPADPDDRQFEIPEEGGFDTVDVKGH